MPFHFMGNFFFVQHFVLFADRSCLLFYIKIYSREYSRSVCIMLGIQAEISAIALDISTVCTLYHLNLFFFSLCYIFTYYYLVGHWE